MDVAVVQAYDQRKKDAYLFLKNVEKAVNSQLPPPNGLRSEIRKMVVQSKTDNSNEHLRLPESAFLNTFVIPKLHELVSAFDGMDDSKAKQALLSEYKWMRVKYCFDGPPFRTLRHPFKKVMGAKPHTIMQQWMSGRDNALTQSSPDICIREPFPFKILFEGKYFEKGGRDRAVTELVTSVYQAFFYRGLPYVPSRKAEQVPWDYEFACMLAGDASEEGSLLKAWEAVPSAVKKGFWEGANIYVMIVRGGQ